MYTRIALIGDDFANTSHNSSIKSVGSSFSTAFMSIHKSKESFNGKLRNIQGSLKSLKEQSKSIDILRNEAADMRYDLEEAIQNDAAKMNIDQMDQDFNAKSGESLRGMKLFTGEVGVAGILKRVATAYKEFSEEAARALEMVK